MDLNLMGKLEFAEQWNIFQQKEKSLALDSHNTLFVSRTWQAADEEKR